MNQLEMKKLAAQAALQYVKADTIVGVGSGSTVNCFIEALGTIKDKIQGAVAASKASEELLRKQGIEVFNANDVSSLDIYVDGADEINPQKMMIKGGGAALTREKIVAALAKKFICIVDSSKQVDVLGSTFPLPVEVIPMARSMVARQIVKLGGRPELRIGCKTLHGNEILDIYDLDLSQPIAMEDRLNEITGIVENGLFAHRPADLLILAKNSGIELIKVHI